MEHRWIRHLTATLAIVTIAGYACAQPAGDLRWTWSGAVTSSGAVVKAGVGRPGLLGHLAVSPRAGGPIAFDKSV